MTTSIAAVRIGAYTMAISNIFGSNLFMLVLVFPAAMLFRGGRSFNSRPEPSVLHNRVDLRVYVVKTRQMRARHFTCRQLLRTHRRSDLARSHLSDVAHDASPCCLPKRLPRRVSTTSVESRQRRGTISACRFETLCKRE
jgi:hypothetical protein